ncbi:SAV_2336 N-terminal domain-related protein [Streptomyces jeddahensis]|uniref:Tetratricopeptide repeat protein n=1 Tax=Streptomyces jeddahensis TaxID=1716141 RepID=A0A177HR86_9ACTN|nr:SAV_2336 N-terminal domain-related protein [Streptomyces jeddahensis]OAH13521.1 hypothetical protein STSP_31990 [Streptomyces jeddahensis]
MAEETAQGRQHPRDPGGERGGAHPPAAGAAGRASLDPLARFVALLREAGLDPDPAQVRDALWLARWSRPHADRSPPGTPASREGHGAVATEPSTPKVEGRPGTGDGPGPAEARAQDRSRPPEADGPVSLFTEPAGRPDGTVADGEGGALQVGVPEAPALPDAPGVQRALRPLRRYRPATRPLRRTLDEQATAETSAGGLLVPVWRADRRAETRLDLVMDASSSMRVWEGLFGELGSIFGQLGIFRDVRTHYLHEGPHGEPGISHRPDPEGDKLWPAESLGDPAGRGFTVLLSDCAGPLWYSGRAHRLLHRLTRQGPTAVLQPLPQRMWGRTRLPVTSAELMRSDGPPVLLGPAARRLWAGGALPVPVLPPVPGALAAWARLMSGQGGGRGGGAVGWVRGDEAPVRPAEPDRDMLAAELVSRFRASASQMAGQLAVYLAAAPLHLPVMRLVQRTMLPDSGPAEMAEVLLSGLLTRADRQEDPGPERGWWYEFAPGVRDALLGPLGRDEALLVFKHCSEYVERTFGRGGPSFLALARAQLGEHVPGVAARPPAVTVDGCTAVGPSPERTFDDDTGDGGEGSTVPQPFAEVAAAVLRRFMTLPERILPGRSTDDQAADRPVHEAVPRARRLVTEYEETRMVQPLIDALQLLRGATRGPGPDREDPRLWSELARCALRLWEVLGGPDLLREAEDAAERAGSLPGGARERAVLARVLRAAAREQTRLGRRQAARDLLRRADRAYTVACNAPGLSPEELERFTLERVTALEAQWRLGGDLSLLQGAVGMLEALSEIRSDQDRAAPAVSRTHGRFLLLLCEAGADREHAVLYARQAADLLRTVLDDPDGAPLDAADLPTVRNLVDALLVIREPDDLAEALALLERVREALTDARLIAEVDTRLGHVLMARHAPGGPGGSPLPERSRELGGGPLAAADAYARAIAATGRDTPEHAELLTCRARALLAAAGQPAAAGALAEAIRVLRDAMAETPSHGPELAERRLLLGQALMRRHERDGDPVDLREAEHLFRKSARGAADPLAAAAGWFELGRAHLSVADSLNRSAGLDEAAEAFRAAAAAAARAGEDGRNREEAAVTAARAHDRMGLAYERAGRPRAAAEAYRAALEEWARLPETYREAAARTARRLEAVAAA